MTELGLWLAMLAGSDRSGHLEGRWRRPGGMGQVFVRTDRLHQLEEMAVGMGARTDFYVGCAPRTHRHGGAEAVPLLYGLWGDLDGREAVARLDRFDPPPTCVIASGSGPNVHAHWQLDRPLEADQGRRALRRLAHALGGDMRSAEPARVLRPPGSFNHKHGTPSPVECLELDTVAYSPAAIVGDLPDPPNPRGREDRASGPVRPLSAVPDRLADICPADYVRALTGLEPDRDGKVSCPFHEDRTPSLHCYPDAERGFYCFSCGRGGRIYDLAAHLGGYRLPLRGADFLTVREVLLDHMGAKAAA